MFKQNELLRKTMIAFRGSFINENNELILDVGTNTYFSLKDCNSELEFKCKILEWCSRDGCKTMVYRKNHFNEAHWLQVRENINQVLETNFDIDDMDLIYTKLGNSVNRTLTIKFIESNYDMNVLKEVEK